MITIDSQSESASQSSDLIVQSEVPVKKKVVKTTMQRRSKPDESTNKKYIQLQSNLERLESQNARQKDEIESLRQQLKEYKAKEVTSNAQLAKMKKLQSDLDNATSVSSASLKEKQQAWNKVSEKDVEIQVWKGKLQEAKQQKESIEQQQSDLNSKYQELEKRYRNDTLSPKDELPALQAEKAKHESVVESLKEQVRRIT